MTNYNERLDEVFETLNNKAREERASCTERNNWEGYNFAYERLENEAKQAITSLIKEHAESELEKFKANNHIGYPYEPGEVTDNYIILERVIKKGKNWVFRVQCRWCGNEMNRMTNKFNMRHIDCKEWGVHIKRVQSRERIK